RRFGSGSRQWRMMDSTAGEADLFHRRTEGSEFFRSAIMTGRISHKGPRPEGREMSGEPLLSSPSFLSLAARFTRPAPILGPSAWVGGEGACGKGKAGLPAISSYRINPRE